MMCPGRDGDACCLSGGVPTSAGLARRGWGAGREGGEGPGDRGVGAATLKPARPHRRDHEPDSGNLPPAPPPRGLGRMIPMEFETAMARHTAVPA